jgi:Neprosin
MERPRVATFRESVDRSREDRRYQRGYAVRVTDEGAFEEMKAHILDLHNGISVKYSWNPSVSPEQISLSQIWVFGGSGESKQTVEAGWQVYPDKWDTNKAVLFVFYTARNYHDGCYHRVAKGSTKS